MNKPSNITLGFPFKECETCNMCEPVINETASKVDYGKILYDVSCKNEGVCSMWKCRMVEVIASKEEDEDECGDIFFEMLNASEQICNVNGEELKVMG